jgi:hypothetical protein
VRVLSLARVLFTVLAFQLALGLQVGVAYAGVAPVNAADAAAVVASVSTPVNEVGSVHTIGGDGTATTGGDEPCPMHNAPSAGSSHIKASHTKAPLEKSTDKHDCCKSSGCQCQCGNVPLAFNVSVTRGISAPALVQPTRASRSPVAPSDNHFRPPIAS